MPAALVSINAKYSPCAASRGASARHDSSTAPIPVTETMKVIINVSSSRRSAPCEPRATKSPLPSPHCQMPSPIAVPNATIVSNGTSCSRMKRPRSRPARSTTIAPPSRARSGEVPAQSIVGLATVARSMDYRITVISGWVARALSEPEIARRR